MDTHDKGTKVYNSISEILGNISTYVLSMEYSLNKLSDLVSSMNSLFTSSYNEIYNAVSKKNEVSSLVLRNENVFISLLSKLDTINEVLSQILSVYIRVNDNIRVISDGIVSLNIIATNAEIESFKLNTRGSISAIVDEISKITKDIKSYSDDLISQYNRNQRFF